MAGPLGTTMGHAGASLRRRLQERFAEPAALRAATRRAGATGLRRDLPGDGFGQAEIGREIVAGAFALDGVSCARSPETLFDKPGPNAAWDAAAHGFEWLADLDALGGARASEAGRAAAASWMKVGATYHPVVWRPDVAARRLRAWLRYADLIAPAASDAEGAVARMAATHAEWLERRLDDFPSGPDAIEAAIAVATAALALDGWSERWGGAIAAVERALKRSTPGDGGPTTRAPEDAFRQFTIVTMFLEQCRALGVDAPEAARDAARRYGGALRFFRAADGGLPLFHGGRERADGRVEQALAAVKLPAEPLRSLDDAGYHRMVGGRVAVIMDVGPSPATAAGRAHASALALEVTSARRRLIVNVGSGAHLDDAWRAAARGGEAHSTLLLDEKPFVSTTRRIDPLAGVWETAFAGPPNVRSDRKEERNGVWVMCGHDGYLASHGAEATRRLFLSADGGDFRGEDSLNVPEAGKRTFERALARASRGRRDAGMAFVARFHLHPEVSAAIVADGEAITLRLPHGEVWVMRQAGGALSLEPSVYLGGGGRPVDTRQIVIAGATRRDGAQIRWAFRRVGDIAQLPKDFDALAAAPRVDRPIDEAELNAAAGRPAR